MLKRIVYIVLLIVFTAGGFASGYFLVNSDLISFFINLPQQFKYGFIGLSTLLFLVAGILLPPGGRLRQSCLSALLPSRK